ncbi:MULTISPECIES: tetratricopeptide repeat protein [unclassified Undibacterium]|nr:MULTISPECIES: tetratricopeptide repeat protein [unclassified Undibacterium]MEB0215843.1 tetratricopeptide repeat protein [Undibacterium sp. 5I2]WPX42694.1 tetratricopeptide repeat protein [Undibacterium sp. CCC3.4]
MKAGKLKLASIGEAKKLFKANALPEAELACRQLIGKFPLHAEANYLLAKIALKRQDCSLAFTYLRSAMSSVQIRSQDAREFYDFLDVCLSTLQFELMEQGSLWLSAQCPKDAYAWDYLAISFIQQEKFQVALAAAEKSLVLLPTNARMCNNAGAALNGLHKFAAAIPYLERAVLYEPSLANAHNNLGNALNGVERKQEAIYSYLRAIAIDSNSYYIHSNLAGVYVDLQRFEEATTHHLRSIELNPAYIKPYAALINTFARVGQVGAALDLAQVAFTHSKDDAELWSAYGNTLQKAHQLDAAIEAYMQALKLEKDPQSDFARKVFSSLLFTLNCHADLSAEVIYSAYQDFEIRFGVPFRSAWTVLNNEKNPGKRLKVGYLSQAFCNQVCRYFLLPLLEQHDSAVVEVFAYSDPPYEDHVTERYQASVDHWRDTRGMSDEAIVELIKSDGIDILIDISGHSTDNRLGVFARKPAPVSLHWLDFGYTTGLTAVDYYLTDSQGVTDDCDHLFSEKLWRLDGPAFAYRPDFQEEFATDSPFLQDGIITFGSLSRANRINHKLIAVWAAILDAMPNSRLVINSGDFKDKPNQDAMAQRFVDLGIARDRLEVGYDSPSRIPLSKIDISLDCFPHNSGTTLIESLYMGVPFVSLANRPTVGRIGSSVLAAAGHREWIAETEMEYAEKVLTLAHDTEALIHLRKNLRREIQGSPLMDEVGFARSVEKAYRQMWQIYCQKDNA